MLKLHKVTLTHYAPKDSKTAILAYMLADSEEQVMVAIAKHPGVNVGWFDEDEEDEVDVDDVDDDDHSRAAELGITIEDGIASGPSAAMVRWWRGDSYQEVEDAYYGVSQYAWDAGVEITEADAAVLLRLGVALDARVRGVR